MFEEYTFLSSRTVYFSFDFEHFILFFYRKSNCFCWPSFTSWGSHSLQWACLWVCCLPTENTPGWISVKSNMSLNPSSCLHSLPKPNTGVCHGLRRLGPGDWSWWEEECRGPKSQVKQGCFICRNICLYIVNKMITQPLKRMKFHKSFKYKVTEESHWRESKQGPFFTILSPENCVQLCWFLFSRNW